MGDNTGEPVGLPPGDHSQRGIAGGVHVVDVIGDWLFRYRSWFPPLLLVVLGLALNGRPRGVGSGLEAPWLILGTVVAAAGVSLRAHVVGTAPHGTSGRNTMRQKASQLNTTGLYSVIRHPLYLGNLLLWMGPALATGVWWTVLLVGLTFALVYGPIIKAEERFLNGEFGADYRAWAAATPRLVPKLRRWTPPALPFSLKTVMRQEYYGWFTIVLMFVLLDTIARTLALGELRVDPLAAASLAVTGVASGVFRYLQRHSTILDVPGR